MEDKLEEKKSSKIKLQVTLNGNNIPVNGEPTLSHDKDNNMILTFVIGTAKLDTIKLKFEEVTYIEPIKNE